MFDLRPFQSTQTVNNPGQANRLISQAITQNKAELLIFPRRNYAKQIVRPLQYEFTDQMKSSIVHSLDQNVPFTKLNNINARGILPTSHGGYDLNMSAIEDHCGFLLTITTVGTRYAPPEKLLYGGYFLDEPKSLGGHYNPDAFMMFTHTSVLTDNSNNKFGNQRNPLTITADTVTIGKQTEQYINSNDRLFWNLPSDVDSLPAAHMHQGATDMAGIIVSNTNNPINLPKFSLIPAMMLNSIGENIRDYSKNKDLYKLAIASATPIGDHYSHHDSFMLSRGLQDRLPGLSGNTGHITTSSGIDESRPHTLGSILAKYPDIDVFNMNLGNITIANGEGIDQEYNSRQTVLSYLISYTIECIAINAGLTSVDFMYMSDMVEPNRIWTGKKNPKMIIDDAIPVSDSVDKVQIRAMADKFEQMMIDNVFSTADASLDGSDYEVYVHYRHGQTVQVKVVLKDYMSSHQDGYYEAYGHISSLSAPTVGNVNLVFNNRAQMDALHGAVENL